MASDVVVDTCIWIQFFNQPASRAKRAIDVLIDEGRAVVVGPILAEVMQACSSPKEAEEMSSLLAGLDSFPVTQDTWRRAGLMALDERGNKKLTPLSDLVVAAVAIEHNLEVYTTDPHFRKIPGVKLYKK